MRPGPAALAALAAAALGPLYGGRLDLETASLPRSLAPDRPADAAARLAAGLLHETLIRWSARGEALPAVAARWTSAASEREWHLELSPHARFHDGAAVRAEDVVRSLRRYLHSDSTAAAVLAGRLDGGLAFRARRAAELPGLAATAADRVSLRFALPVPGALAPLAAAAAAITDARGRGCGPFVPAVFEPGRRLELAAAAAHPAGRPFLDRVLLRVSPSEDRPLPTGGETPLLLLLALDAGRPPFDVRERRRALAASIDRQALSERFLPGARPVTGLDARGDGALPPPSASPRQRAAITLSVAEDVPRAASRRVVAQLAAAGVSAEVELLSPASARYALAAARLLLWAPEVAEPGLALREAATLVRVPPGVERALRRAETELDPGLRSEQLERAHRELIDDAALIPLAAVPVGLATPAGLRGARVDATGTLRLDGAWLLP